jgi:uncharacterized membrane protein
MISDYSTPRARIIVHPVLLLLVSFPIACFTGALATDIAYARTADMMWADFSAWLLAVGMLCGSLAALAGIVGSLASRWRWQRAAWPFLIGCLLVLVFALFDNFVHSRDAWTSVVPTGLALSGVTVAAMLVTVWLGAAPLRGDALRARSSGGVL